MVKVFTQAVNTLTVFSRPSTFRRARFQRAADWRTQSTSPRRPVRPAAATRPVDQVQTGRPRFRTVEPQQPSWRISSPLKPAAQHRDYSLPADQLAHCREFASDEIGVVRSIGVRSCAKLVSGHLARRSGWCGVGASMGRVVDPAGVRHRGRKASPGCRGPRGTTSIFIWTLCSGLPA
jgi:hypothetical protein